jgi:inosine/xanthosine triphosphate pyrophosphatase family protein
LKRLVATTNPGKVIEIQSALERTSGWKLEPIPTDTPSIEETGKVYGERD